MTLNAAYGPAGIYGGREEEPICKTTSTAGPSSSTAITSSGASGTAAAGQPSGKPSSSPDAPASSPHSSTGPNSAPTPAGFSVTEPRAQEALPLSEDELKEFLGQLHSDTKIFPSTAKMMAEQALAAHRLQAANGSLTAALAGAREEETRACIEALKKRGDGAYSQARGGMFYEAAGTLAERLPSPTSEKAEG